MTTGERITLWPTLLGAAFVLAALIAVVLWRGSFVALAAIALAPLFVIVLWFTIRGKWLRQQVDALPRYLTSRRIHVILAEANEMQITLDRQRAEWGWTWSKEDAFHGNMAQLEPKVARARATGLYALRTRRPERMHKGRLQDALRVHRDLRRHLVLSLAQEVERREQRHAADLAGLRERGLCTFEAGAGLSKELRWLDVNARIKRIRDEQLLAVKEALAALPTLSGEPADLVRQVQERQRVGDPAGAIQILLRLRPRTQPAPPPPAASSPFAPVQADRPPAPPPPSEPAPNPDDAPRRPRKRGEAL